MTVPGRGGRVKVFSLISVFRVSVYEDSSLGVSSLDLRSMGGFRFVKVLAPVLGVCEASPGMSLDLSFSSPTALRIVRLWECHFASLFCLEKVYIWQLAC